MLPYSPEGTVTAPPTAEQLHSAIETEEILQGTCVKCDEFHNLLVDLGPIKGIIPREETALGIAEGTLNEYAILSRVGKTVSFRVLSMDRSGQAVLSRRKAQEEARSFFLSAVSPGDVIPAVVQTPANFGVFCDIGCGFIALMRIDRCCVSRLRSTAERFRPGEQIFAAVLSVDDAAEQINLTGRELLGTWEENAERFRSGQTVVGIVRSIMPYGLFVELTPNLSGLSEYQSGIQVGDRVSVYIRSIQPDRHKVKLTILEKLGTAPPPSVPEYFLTSGHIRKWEYYPGSRTVTYF